MKTRKQRYMWALLGNVSLFAVIGLILMVAVGPSSADPILTASKSDIIFIDSYSNNVANAGDTIRYTTIVTNSGSTGAVNMAFVDTIDPDTTLVAGSVRTTPIARHDTYTSIGNVGISVPAGSGVLANDNDPDGSTPVLTIVSFDATSANGGSVAVAADGSFTYLPTPGFEGSDSYTYTIQDSDGNTDPATVVISVNDVIWFIDNSAGGGGDGRLGTPFDSLAAYDATAADESGDVIFLYESGSGDYSGGIILLNDQKLIGEGATATIASIAGITLPAFSNALPATSGSKPTIINAAGNGITLAANNTIRGLNVGNTTATGIAGSSVGTLTLSDVSITGSGKGVDINGGAMAATFDSIAVSSSTTGGVSLQSVSGTTNINALSITNSSSTGLLALSAGTININGAGNIINTTNGTAVNLTNTSIGSSGITFLSVSASGTDTGITLNNTGIGDFTITGNGTTDGSGGILTNLNDHGIELINVQDVFISNMNLNNAALTQEVEPNTVTCTNLSNGSNLGCNAPVHMVNANNINLTNLTINGSVQHGVNGNNVNGLTISNTDVTNIGNQNKENGMHFINLLGTVSFSNVSVIGSNTRNVLIENNTGIANVTVTGSTFNTAGSEVGLDFLGLGTANITFSVSGSSFYRNNSVQLKALASGSSTMNATINGSNTFEGNPAVTGNSGVDLDAVDGATLTFNVSGNTFQPFRSQVINVFTSGGGTASGRVNGNTITGSAFGAGVRAVAEVTDVNGTNPGITIEINNNSISGVAGGGLAGIHIEARDGSNGLTGVANVDATVINNNVTTNGADAAIQVYLEDLNGTANRVCINATGNATQAVGGAFGETDFFFGNNAASGTNSGIAQMQGYSGSVSNTWFTVNSNTSTTTIPFADSLGPIGSGTCALVASVLPAANTPMITRDVPVLHLTQNIYSDLEGVIDNALMVQRDRFEKQVSAVDRSDLVAFNTQVKAKVRTWADWFVSAFRVSPVLASGETINLDLGDLDPGQQVTITFDVTVDSTIPETATQVCNQGTFTGDNVANLLTDDPDPSGPADPTCTIASSTTAVTFTTLQADQGTTGLLAAVIGLAGSAVLVYALSKRGIKKSDLSR